MSNEEKIIALGKADYFKFRGVYKNPYTSGVEFNAYERGWMQSLKRDDGKLVNAANPINTPSLPADEMPSEPPVNLYALLKGRSSPRDTK